MTAIEWLVNVVQSCIAPDYIPKEIIEQAKEMEKQQMFDYIKKNYVNGEHSLKFHKEEFEHYYNETYGSKGSDATSSQTEKCCTPEGQIKRYVDCIGCDRKASSQTTSDKWKEYQDWLNEVPEISDEEIEKGAEEKYPYNELRDGEFKGMLISAKKNAWVDAIKWYREQLKSRQ